MARKVNKLAMLLKRETTEGTDAVPTAAANAIKAKNITYTPIDGEDVPTDFILPWLGHQGVDLAGKFASIEFEVELSGAGAAGTAPAWGAAMRACGVTETITASTKVEYEPNSEGTDSCSIYFNDDGIKQVILGAKGTVQLQMPAKKVPTLKFKMIGLLGTFSDAALPAVTTTAWIKGLVAEKGITTFSIDAYEAALENLAIDFGMKAELRSLVNITRIDVTDRKSTGTAVIEQPLLATWNPYAKVLSRARMALAVQHGVTAGNIVKIDADAVELGKPTQGQSQGNRTTSLPLYFVPTAGDDEWKITVQ